MAYSGTFKPSNTFKYDGDSSKITYRSLWELNVMKWLDLNPDVDSWSSEEVIIPYVCKTDGKPHRYFMDFKIKFKSGKVVLVEVKPSAQVAPPKKRRKTDKYIKEVMTYAKNVSKWTAAREYVEKRGWEFQIWTEHTLEESLGIKTTLNYKNLNRKAK